MISLILAFLLLPRQKVVTAPQTLQVRNPVAEIAITITPNRGVTVLPIPHDYFNGVPRCVAQFDDEAAVGQGTITMTDDRIILNNLKGFKTYLVCRDSDEGKADLREKD